MKPTKCLDRRAKVRHCFKRSASRENVHRLVTRADNELSDHASFIVHEQVEGTRLDALPYFFRRPARAIKGRGNPVPNF